MEYCASVKSVKYLFKYVYKGHDVANATATLIHIAPPPEIVNDEGAAAAAAAAPPAPDIDALAAEARQQPERFVDEIVEYLTGRYVGASEAAWRIYAFKLQDRGAKVERLPCHLPGQVTVEFDETDDLQAVLEAGHGGSKLTAWFDLNQRDPSAADILYQDIPTYYTWHGRAGDPAPGGGESIA